MQAGKPVCKCNIVDRQRIGAQVNKETHLSALRLASDRQVADKVVPASSAHTTLAFPTPHEQSKHMQLSSANSTSCCGDGGSV